MNWLKRRRLRKRPIRNYGSFTKLVAHLWSDQRKNAQGVEEESFLQIMKTDWHVENAVIPSSRRKNSLTHLISYRFQYVWGKNGLERS